MIAAIRIFFFLSADQTFVETKRGNSKPSATLFVGNLPYTTTESDLMKFFDGCVKATIIAKGHNKRNW